MRNLAAYLFVLVFLTACAAYTWEHTYPPGSMLANDYGADLWHERVRAGW